MKNKTEIASHVHRENLVKWAKNKPQVVVLSADLTSSTEIDLFRQVYPDRFFPLGIAEQNMLSFAGGLAREGFVPFIHTFAVFIYRRAYDQAAMSIAYPNLPVKLFGFLPGVTTPGGATHQAIEDIAVMRALPNMTILECGDATDVESVLDVAYAIRGPVYIRMLRGDIPRLFSRANPMVLGKSRRLSLGNDLVILSSGVCTEEVLRVSHVLKKRGLSIEHYHVTTLKPFQEESIIEKISRVKFGVITMENHSVVGGLGTIIAEKMAEKGIGKKLLRVGIRDTFLHGASRKYLLKEYGLDALSLVKTMEELIGKKLAVREADLADVRTTLAGKDSRAEAL